MHGMTALSNAFTGLSEVGKVQFSGCSEHPAGC